MAEKTAKVVNYTPEMVARMTAEYTAKPEKATVEALAVEFGKSTKQIVAKLVNLKIYVKASPEKGKTKTGEKVETKDTTADAIGRVLGLSEPDVESLTKANKRALQAIFAALANSRPIDGND